MNRRNLLFAACAAVVAPLAKLLPKPERQALAKDVECDCVSTPPFMVGYAITGTTGTEATVTVHYS